MRGFFRIIFYVEHKNQDKNEVQLFAVANTHGERYLATYSSSSLNYCNWAHDVHGIRQYVAGNLYVSGVVAHFVRKHDIVGVQMSTASVLRLHCKPKRD